MTASPPIADVALLLEGTYPYVQGGVSSWVHEIITGLPEVRFSLVFVGGSSSQHKEARFKLPPNVVRVDRHYLFDPPAAGRRHPRAIGTEVFERLSGLHAALRGGGRAAMMAGEGLAAILSGERPLRREHFLHDESAWEMIRESFARGTEPSFLDFFWTVRTMHAPLFSLAELAERLPPARVYHTISTGYAGFLGALLHRRDGRPLLTTEHGIYTKERAIDLASAGWIKDPPGSEHRGDLGYLRQLWIRFFQGLGRMAYGASHKIVSLYEGNRRRQLQDGAAADRTCVIPNGIDLARFRPLRAQRAATPPPIIGLLGRVVPIKDVKTFVRAMRIICDRLPAAEGWIVGPTGEDEAYAHECRELAAMLGLGDKVKFLGFRKPEEVLPKLGLMALTSISEALPLVVLEAWASGLPVVVTDVGACRELVEGRTPHDRALGAAGAVCPIASPETTADAALGLLSDPERWRAAQQAGMRRVEEHYTREKMLDAYRTLYGEALRWPG